MVEQNEKYSSDGIRATSTFNQAVSKPMIISPPFLPPITGQSEDDWLEVAMKVSLNEGEFPVTDRLSWHGGIHLQADIESLVSAIADGKVMYVRKPSPRNSDPQHPLNYHGGGAVSGWTSDGCVVLKHETEIGEGANGAVAFYSIYMHLEEIPKSISKGRIVARKDVLGRAGFIYGKSNLLHLEIVCDDENLCKLVGRSSGNLATDIDGRTSTIFGEIHFYLPKGTQIFSDMPQIPGGASSASMPSPYSIAEDLVVSIRYDRHAYVSTCKVNGEFIGQSIRENNVEYDLFKIANSMHTPCPSATYELLRFGRVIGPHASGTVANSHWRKINHPAGQGWVDLAADKIHKSSDADFPHWRGWMLIDDCLDMDSRMSSATIRQWLDMDSDGNVTPLETRALLRSGDVRKKLKRAICKMPTEWNAATIDARWSWLKTESPENPDNLSSDDFEELKRHISKLCFWDDAALEIKPEHWHFDPATFIKHFRSCGWLSQREMLQLVPHNVIRKPGSHGSNTQGVWESPNLNSARNFVSQHGVELNKALRKFFITTPNRMAAFYGNAVQETGWFKDLRESGGTNAGLHQGWYGRGFLQLTNPSGLINNGSNNYYKYFRFMGLAPVVPPGQQEFGWRDQLGSDSFHAAHSACAYWVWPDKGAGVHNANILADLFSDNQRKTIYTPAGTKVWYYNRSFAKCASAVNLPGSVSQDPPNSLNGLVDRSTAYINALVVLGDVPVFRDAQNYQLISPENFKRRTPC